MIGRVWRRAVGFGFRLLYHECAFSYDFISFAVSLGHWRRWQRAALRFLPENGAVLELAHGTGQTQLDLLRAGYRCVGIDLSPNMGRLARRKLQRAGVSGDLTRGDALSLPCADASFSAIICAFPTAFIFDPACLNEMFRVLENGGIAVVVLSRRPARWLAPARDFGAVSHQRGRVMAWRRTRRLGGCSRAAALLWKRGRWIVTAAPLRLRSCARDAQHWSSGKNTGWHIAPVCATV